MKDYRMYILVNDDVKIGKGKLAGQVGHAVAVYFYINFHEGNNQYKIIEEYMNTAQKKIILKCPQSKLEELEISGHITIRDNGLTQLEPNTLTCVNIGIYDANEVPSFVSELKLV